MAMDYQILDGMSARLLVLADEGQTAAALSLRGTVLALSGGDAGEASEAFASAIELLPSDLITRFAYARWLYETQGDANAARRHLHYILNNVGGRTPIERAKNEKAAALAEQLLFQLESASQPVISQP